MKTCWTLFLIGVSVFFLPEFTGAEESSCYLGRKLEFVLRQVDNSYVERNKEDFTNRHKKALRDLENYLTENYPDFQTDLIQWVEENYGTELDEIVNPNVDEERVSLNTLLVLDRQDNHFRGTLLAYIKAGYPRLFGQIACFLRDNHPAALREVLRMTLRMTSHVKPYVYQTGAPLAEAQPSTEGISTEVPNED